MDEQILNVMIKNVEKYYAHTKKNDQTNATEVELLTEHVERTVKYFRKISEQKDIYGFIERFENRIFGKISEPAKRFFGEMLQGVPVFHDIGKINVKFQRHLMENPQFSKEDALSKKVGSQHSMLSSVIYLDYFLAKLREQTVEKEEKVMLKLCIFLNAYVISRHHSSLSSLKDYFDKLREQTLKEVLELFQEGKVDGYLSKFTLSGRKLEGAIKHIYDKKVLGALSEEQSIAVYIYTKLIYSLLVAADYYATSEFMNQVEITEFGNVEEMESWRKRFEDTALMQKIREYQKNVFPKQTDLFQKEREINVLRTEILCDAEQQIMENSDKDLFYLEAPTGSGKSNTAIDLTFQLMKQDRTLQKIVYIYPFNTLVEQNLQTLKKVFGEKTQEFQNIAVVNSLTPIKTPSEKKGIENECDSAVEQYQRALLNRQFLNYPVILSTHVTLFDTVFGNTRESAFGFHQLCNSVIVLDEIQSYKNELWGNIVCFFKEMASLMHAKIIIMSATLPNLDILSQQMNPAVRLLKDSRKYFEHPCFKRRVKVSYELMDVENIEDTLLEHVKQQALSGKKILVEFIKKTTAENFFRALKEDEETRNKTEYMSGDDSIIERKRILDRIDGKSEPVILVATQVVEAGVDIDMDIGYKNISKLDSEEQFLGRINRSCRKEDSVVYFFKIDDSKRVYENNEIRTNKEFTLENEEMKGLLLEKDFQTYYEQILQVLQTNIDKNKAKGLKAFLKEDVGKLDFPQVKTKMQLIEENKWAMSVYLSRVLVEEDGTEIDGTALWKEYIKLLQDFSIDYSEKKVKISRITSKMNYFIYQVKKNQNLIYNDRVGELFFIEDGEQYFDDGKMNRKKIQGEIGEFVDFI